MMVLSKSGQYCAVLEQVSLLKESQLPALMASIHVCLTGKPKHA